MLQRSIVSLSICFLIAGCGSLPVQLTSTALVVEALTETAAPTQTSLPTFAPTSTPTLTPTPTPLGGGNGRLIFFINPWMYDRNPTLREEDGLYSVNSDGSGLQQILSRSQLESMTGTEYRFGIYSSYAGKNYILTDSLYSVTDEWQLVEKIDVPNPGLFHSREAYASYAIQISTIGGWQNQNLLGANDAYVGMSADGSTIYLQKDQGRSMWAMNSDGSNKRNLALTALREYTPYEGVSLPEGILGWAPYRLIDSYAVSPDGTQVAFTWADLLFVAESTDLEFSSPRLILQLPHYFPEGTALASDLVWAPDGESIVVKLRETKIIDFDIRTDIILVDLDGGGYQTIIPSSEFEHQLCGYSPDARQVVSLYHNVPEKKSVLVLTALDNNSSITIPHDGSVTCPTWQLSNEQK